MYLQNERRSVLEIPPMGLMSALEQSYLVKYPRSASSTLADPSTSSPPLPPTVVHQHIVCNIHKDQV